MTYEEKRKLEDAYAMTIIMREELTALAKRVAELEARKTLKLNMDGPRRA